MARKALKFTWKLAKRNLRMSKANYRQASVNLYQSRPNSSLKFQSVVVVQTQKWMLIMTQPSTHIIQKHSNLARPVVALSFPRVSSSTKSTAKVPKLCQIVAQLAVWILLLTLSQRPNCKQILKELTLWTIWNWARRPVQALKAMHLCLWQAHLRSIEAKPCWHHSREILPSLTKCVPLFRTEIIYQWFRSAAVCSPPCNQQAPKVSILSPAKANCHRKHRRTRTILVLAATPRIHTVLIKPTTILQTRNRRDYPVKTA